MYPAPSSCYFPVFFPINWLLRPGLAAHPAVAAHPSVQGMGLGTWIHLIRGSQGDCLLMFPGWWQNPRVWFPLLWAQVGRLTGGPGLFMPTCSRFSGLMEWAWGCGFSSHSAWLTGGCGDFSSPWQWAHWDASCFFLMQCLLTFLQF